MYMHLRQILVRSEKLSTVQDNSSQTTRPTRSIYNLLAQRCALAFWFVHKKKEKLLRYADWNTPLYIVYDDSHYATFSYIQTKLEARPHAMTLHCFTAYTLPRAQGIVSHFPYLSMTPCVRPCCSVCLNGTSSPCDRWAPPPLTVAVSHFWMQ